MDEQQKTTQYIGGGRHGVYAEFNGYSIVLKANSHIHPTDTIYLDREVMRSLIDYAQKYYNKEGEEW